MTADISVLRAVIERNLGYLDETDFEALYTQETSAEHHGWATDLEAEWQERQAKREKTREPESDPWATADPGGFSDEPPF
jgi:hypothetical protein